MALAFKCCKKSHNNWICILCHSVFHKSCRSRLKKGVEVVGDNLILCSTQCSELANDSDPETFASLVQIIKNLKTDLIDSSNYIERLRSEKQTLLDEAESLERQLVDENTELKNRIAVLDAKSSELIVKNVPKAFNSSSTQTPPAYEVAKIDSCCQTTSMTDVRHAGASKDELQTGSTLQADLLLLTGDLQRSMDELSELKELKERMLVTIETLNNDNIFLSSELERLKQLLSNPLPPIITPEAFSATNNSSDQQAVSSLFDELSVVDRHMAPLIRKKRNSLAPYSRKLSVSSSVGTKNVLVFGDRSASGVATGLLSFTDSSEYSTYGEIHPGYSIPQMAERLFQLTTNFNWQDNVIVCINLGSIGRVSSYLLNKLFSIGKYTNLIFSLTFSSPDKDKYFSFVSFCQRFLKRQSASIRTLDNDFVGGKFRLARESLCKHLYTYVSVSYMLKYVFVSSYIRHCDFVNDVAVSDQALSDQSDAGDDNQQGSFLG